MLFPDICKYLSVFFLFFACFWLGIGRLAPRCPPSLGVVLFRWIRAAYSPLFVPCRQIISAAFLSMSIRLDNIQHFSQKNPHSLAYIKNSSYFCTRKGFIARLLDSVSTNLGRLYPSSLPDVKQKDILIAFIDACFGTSESGKFQSPKQDSAINVLVGMLISVRALIGREG